MDEFMIFVVVVVVVGAVFLFIRHKAKREAVIDSSKRNPRPRPFDQEV